MTIVRCRKCHIVVLDSVEDGLKDVLCNECGTRYRIKIHNDRVTFLGRFGDDGALEELENDEAVIRLDTIEFKKAGKIAYIVLNRPEEQNRINARMRVDILACINMLEVDDSISLGIFKGNGKTFSAGNEPDTGEARYGLSKRPDGRVRRPSQRAKLWVGKDEQRFISRIRDCSKPLICQAHGSCFDDALALSIACDITVATEDCLFGYPDPEQRWRFGGMLGFYGAREVTLIGPKKAREMHLLGTKINGKEAERIGLINYAVPIDRLEEKVESMAHEIVRLPKDALFIGKQGTRLALNNWESSPLQGVVMKTISTDMRIEPNEKAGL